MKLKFKKDQILKKLIENKKEHTEIVKEAQEGFREKISEILEDALRRVKAGESFNPYGLFGNLRMPENHVDDYDRHIEMLEMCNDEEIEMDENQFQCYIRNNWSWMQNFLLSNCTYSKTASDLMKQ